MNMKKTIKKTTTKVSNDLEEVKEPTEAIVEPIKGTRECLCGLLIEVPYEGVIECECGRKHAR